MSFYGQLIIVLILDVVSALTARYSYNIDSDFYLIISMVSLAMAGYFFMQLLNHKVTIIVNAIWIALGTINVTIASYLVFNEALSWMQVIGMSVIVIGLILIEAFAPDEEPQTESLSD